MIRDNETNTIVYNIRVNDMYLYHIIPANTLTNGKQYNIQVRVFDSNNNASDFSNPVVFYCYSTPEFSIANIASHDIIENSSFEVSLNYSQYEDELLDSYQVELFDTHQSLIYSSDVKYDTSDLSVVLYGLEDNMHYYIRATGITVNRILLNTGMTEFSVEYINPSVFSIVELTNLPRTGEIKIHTNIISITGESIPTNISYIDSSRVDIKNSGSMVYYKNQFTIPDNFTKFFSIYNPNDYSVIYKAKSDNNGNIIQLKYMRGYYDDNMTEKAYFSLRVYNAITSYVLYSDYFDIPLSTDCIHVFLQKNNNLYDMKCEVVT